MKKTTKLVGLLSVAALVLGACNNNNTGATGGTTSGADKPELEIVYMAAITGDLAQLTIHAKQAAELFVEQANQRGDLPVRLKVTSEDTQADKDKAATIAQGVKDKANLLLVLGPAFSGESFGAGPVLEAAGIARVTPSATNPGIAEQDLFFRMLGNDNSQGGSTVPVMLNHYKFSKIYIGHDKTAYGEGLATIVRNQLQTANSGALVGFEGTDAGKKDYGPLVTKIIGSGADAFYWGGYSPEAILILKQLKERNWNGRFVGTDGSKDTSFLEGTKGINENVIITCPCADVSAESASAEAKKFASDYKAKFNTDPGIYAGEAWDSMLVIADALKKAGEYTGDIKAYRTKVYEAIAATSGVQGVTKSAPYKFQENGELADAIVETYIYEVKSNAYVQIGLAKDLGKA